jgi:CRP/FNR family cyclic AMP-dependent transcriptional regulator
MMTYPITLKQIGICSTLSPAIIGELESIAVPMERAAGTSLQLEGEPVEAMYLVLEGQVKVSRLASNGREQVLTVVGPGGHFNTAALFDGARCPANADALTDVALLALPRAAVLKLVEAHPPLMWALLQDLARQLHSMVDLVDMLALHTVHGRLAGLLLAQARAAAGVEQVIPLTQAEMAARLGTVREMVGRSLKSFEAQGLIRLERGAIVVLDWGGLARQSDH